MIEQIEEAMGTLKDVQGVAGSVLVDAEGDLLARMNLSNFEQEQATALGPQLSRMFEAYRGSGQEAEECVLNCEEFIIVFKPISDCFLCVFAEPSTALPELNVAINVAAQKIQKLSEETEVSDPADEEPKAEAAYEIVYRGTKVR